MKKTILFFCLFVVIIIGISQTIELHNCVDISITLQKITSPLNQLPAEKLFYSGSRIVRENPSLEHKIVYRVLFAILYC